MFELFKIQFEIRDFSWLLWNSFVWKTSFNIQWR